MSTTTATKTDNGESTRPGYNFLDKLWGKMPNIVGKVLATLIIFIVATSMKGDWLVFLVHFFKHWRNETSAELDAEKDEIVFMGDWVRGFLKHYRLENVYKYIIIDVTVSIAFYFTFAGFLHWWFYVRQRDHPETWKCQPKQFLSRELEWREVKTGSRNIVLGGIVFGALACYVDNGGWTTLYYKWDEMGWLYFILSIPIHFLYQDGLTYYGHRLLHVPIIYKNIHKEHHLYKQPTPFSVSALHPVEFFFFQGMMISPIFIAPIHAGIYFLNLIYIYYYGIVTHSGINWKSIWPWQPEVMFHDNHHQYFHVNYGFNTAIWDRLHGTYRKKDRVYGEEIFGGRGKEISEANSEEIRFHEEELTNELDWNKKYDTTDT